MSGVILVGGGGGSSGHPPTLGSHDLVTPRKAFAKDHPCELIRFHAPTPVITEFHHSKPVYLQNRLYGKVRYPADLWVCSNCHEAIHAWLYWLLRERSQPPHMGRLAKAAAQRTFDWYESERAAA